MRYTIFVNTLALVAAMSSGALAQSSSSSPEAARAATDAAKNVSTSLQGQPVLTGPTTRKPILTVPSGLECTGAYAASADVARTRINPAGALAPNSSTIVQLPLVPVRSDYLADVRNTTLRAAIAEGCGQPSH
ncbi:MAG TPA: hypothetical protein VMA36_14340 [Candidatus Limnocylindria bacterium]|nr:hypothetical protein [Candidatus Limnocylindria bacterium]